MKYLYTLLVVLTLDVSISMAQTAPPSQAAAQPAALTDIYHVHFNKAALGQATALGEQLKTQTPPAPMQGHFIVLRHQQGDDWDYCVIQHIGTRATIDAAALPPLNPAARNLSAWHSDTFVAGPAWPEFARAMGIPAASGTNPANFVYSVAVWRAAPGHRDQLEQVMKQLPAAKVPTGRALLMHVEGGPWQYLAIERYNSWQDFATDSADAAPATGSGRDPWSQVREHSSYHVDTLADRIAPR